MIAAELARGDGSIATLNAVHSGLAMTTIGDAGLREQRAQYLPRMAACEVLGAFALTEPEPRLRRRCAGNHGRAGTATNGCWTGEKRWIGNGTVADVVVVWARDDDGNVGAFVVEHPDGAEHPVPGYHARKIVGKAANRGVWQAQIRLDGVRVPPAPDWPRPAPGTTPTMCWPSPGRPSPGRRSATPSPPTRPPSRIRCAASSSAARWPGSS